MKYFGSHLKIEDSTPGVEKFINFVFVIQGASVLNLKSVAQIVFEIWEMKYFGSHLGIKGSTPCGPKLLNFLSL